MYRDFMNADGLACWEDIDDLLTEKDEILRPIWETTSRYVWNRRHFFAAALIGAEGIETRNMDENDWWLDESTEKFFTTLEVLREKASFLHDTACGK